MRHFIPQKKSQTLFYFMSSIFLIAFAPILAKSVKINYDDYYFNTTEGDIYKLGIISQVGDKSLTYIYNCTLEALINGFRDNVISAIHNGLCDSKRVPTNFFNSTLSKEFVRFDIATEGQTCKFGQSTVRSSGHYGYLAILYQSGGKNLNFENCVMKSLESAYKESMNNYSSNQEAIIVILILLSICIFWPSVILIADKETRMKVFKCINKPCIFKYEKTVLYSDAKIKETMDQPLINGVASRRYDGIDHGDNDDAEDDNDSNDASTARP